MSRRRRKSNLLEDLFGVVSLLPWWLGLVLALVSYLVFHALLQQTPSPVTQTSAVISHAFFTPLYAIGQVLAPLLCLLAAVTSFVRSRHRRQLFQRVASTPAADAVDLLTWQDFEKLVAEAFQREGYRVVETGGGGPDGGVDLVLRRGHEKFLVQCKQWKAYKVGVDVVRELYGVMAARGATGGFVVTSGTYTNDAKAFAEGRNVRLIDGSELRLMMDRANKAKPAAPYPASNSAPYPAPVSSPACPVCGSRMELRKAKQGPNAGSTFWGCSQYPKCKGTANSQTEPAVQH